MLLSDDDLDPSGLENGDGGSPFLVICDHAGRLVPPALGTLGLSDDQLATHIAWDLGALGLARRLAQALDACLVWQRYSRLVIDCNRPLTAVDSIVALSEGTPIPGNAGLSPAAVDARVREVFEPYHAEIEGVLARHGRERRHSVLVSVHTFTPVFLGVARPWQVGVLYERDARLAHPLLRSLRDEGDLGAPVVGDNEPYAANELSDHSIIQHGVRRGIPHVELEVRQDLVADEAGQEAWARRFARLLVVAMRSVFPTAPLTTDLP